MECFGSGVCDGGDVVEDGGDKYVIDGYDAIPPTVDRASGLSLLSLFGLGLWYEIYSNI